MVFPGFGAGLLLELESRNAYLVTRHKVKGTDFTGSGKLMPATDFRCFVTVPHRLSPTHKE
jgi:hypothetical protein